MATVKLAAIEQEYAGGVKAVRGIDLMVPDGSFTVLVGPSGCGKSTLLRLIAGLEEITGGEVQIAGQRANDQEPAARNIAMVFQNYALYPHMTVYRNMAYGLQNRGMPKDEIEQRVRRAAKILELEQLLERRPRQLSGGQRQRVAMGRAIVRDPAVFLFDEPLSNLDAKLRVQMRLEIRKLHRLVGATSIYVTHDQVEAMTLGDQLVVMNEGRAEQIGTPEEVYARPATQFVAGFIGSPPMNFIPAPMLSAAASYLSGFVVGETIIGFRPESLQGSRSDNAVIPVNLVTDLVESLGADRILYGHLAETDILVAVRLPATAAAAHGEVVTLYLAPEDLHFFDRDSGRRVEPSKTAASRVAVTQH